MKQFKIEASFTYYDGSVKNGDVTVSETEVNTGDLEQVKKDAFGILIYYLGLHSDNCYRVEITSVKEV